MDAFSCGFGRLRLVIGKGVHGSGLKRLRGPIRSTMLGHQTKLQVVLVAKGLKWRARLIRYVDVDASATDTSFLARRGLGMV